MFIDPRLLKIDALLLFMYRVTKNKLLAQNSPSSPKQLAPMLSDLIIQLPKPQPTKKYSHQPQQTDYCDYPRPPSPEPITKDGSHCFLLSDTRTKNSSASLPFRTESQIIAEWIRNLFQKRGLLGPQWQEKMRRKKRQLLRGAFTAMKQYEGKPQSTYLQTQSKYKPHFSSLKHLHGLASQKIWEILPKIVLKTKQVAFYRILRFLAFRPPSRPQNSQNPHNIAPYPTDSLKLSTSVSNSLRESIEIHNLPRIRYQQAPRQEYDLQPARIRQVHSAKQLPLVENEYALSPSIPVAYEQQGFRVEGERNSREPRESRYMRKSHNMKDSRDSVKIHEQPAWYDSRYDLAMMKESQYTYNNPPSPNSHQFVPVLTQTKLAPSQHQTHQTHQMQHCQNHHLKKSRDNVRASGFVRPHSHNPFLNHSDKMQQKGEEVKRGEEQKQGRNRAVSASPNIKISFMGLQPQNQKEKKKQMPKDYQGEWAYQPPERPNNAHKLGTAQNRQMRQSYQLNSAHHELLPQDYPSSRTPQAFYSPKAPMMSSPVTPKVMHSPVARSAYMGPLSPRSPQSPHSSNPLSPMQNYKAGVSQKASPRVHKEEQRHLIRPDDYNFRRREKLVVTSKRRH